MAEASRSYRTAIVLGAVSGVLLVFALGGSGAHWRPVERPLDLTRPNSIDASFEPRVGASYNLGIEVIRSANSECLLGIHFSWEPPCAVQDPLDVGWQISTSDELVAQGNTDRARPGGWGGGGGMGRVLARLPADDSQVSYDIEVVVRSASPGLANLNPRFVVDVGPGYPDLFRLRVVAVVVGFAGGLVAVVASLWTFSRPRRAS